MKKLTTLTLAALLAFAVNAVAQQPAAKPAKADPKAAQTAEKASDDAAALVAGVRADIQKDRNAIVGAAMDLTDAQAGPFWELYSGYRAARKASGDRLSALIIDYAKKVDTLSDEQALKLLDEMQAIQKQEAATKAEWAQKFRQKLPGKVVTRFFQVDNKLDTIILFQLASEVPLVQ